MSKLSDMHDSKLISENNVKAYAEKCIKVSVLRRADGAIILGNRLV